MKPSQFLKKINVDVIDDLSELDKRFFDKEEYEIYMTKEKAKERGLI